MYEKRRAKIHRCVIFARGGAGLFHSRKGEDKGGQEVSFRLIILLLHRVLPTATGVDAGGVGELFLSTNYFGDLIRQMTDDTASNIIRRFVMSQAQKLLISGMSITSTANQLGFEYPQHFTRMFKKHFGESPSQYVKRKR